MSVTGAKASAWLSAQEIADLRLAGLPTTKRGVHERANAEGWEWQPRPGRGGGRVYSILGMPEAARSDYLGRLGDQPDPNIRTMGRPVGSDFFTRNPDVADAVLSIIAAQKVSAANVIKLLRGLGFTELPPLRMLQRHIRKIEDQQRVLLTAIRDPDRFKSRYRPSLGRMDATVSYAHEMWEIDTTKADVMCTDGRKAILGIIDRWSRRARFMVVESESAQSVRRMLVSTIMAWGVMPAILKVDNGSGFINTSIGSALDTLGIVLEPCLPGTPEDKPHVERLFGTFNRGRASLLKGFIGHNVAQAQQLRAAAKKKTGRAVIEPGIDSTELQRILDAWVDGEYHQRTHGSLKMSPMEKWQRSPTPARAAPPENLLKIALSAFATTAIVGKRGVRWKNGRYWSPALVAHMDKPVTLRRDEDDLGALFVFDADGNYIDTAVNAARSGMAEQQFAMAARHQMTTHMNAAKAELRKKQGKFSIEKARDQLLRQEAEDAGKLAHLPMPARHAPTSAMDSIANAPAPAPVDAARVEEALRTTAPVAITARTPEQKVAEADAILAGHARGDAIDAETLGRARLYAATTEYRAQKIMTGHFAPAPTAPAERRQGAA
ncbi:Mu transposase C-terminal domain-containing protein [Sphingobium aromaticiconvertens]|uniref:Mu transposase C-terminal domain-containing protein n=1 Tax=Sphingobium aromaticiconvertens TaxID=365341 RepID=UPI00301A502B